MKNCENALPEKSQFAKKYFAVRQFANCKLTETPSNTGFYSIWPVGISLAILFGEIGNDFKRRKSYGKNIFAKGRPGF
jgi:hypothetical protein